MPTRSNEISGSRELCDNSESREKVQLGLYSWLALSRNRKINRKPFSRKVKTL